MKMRRLAALGAVLVLAAWMPHERTAPNRWAVIVGISDYSNFGDEAGGDLPGAAWDARRVRDVLLARWGFDDGGIRMLLDGDASRDAIRDQLTEWLPSVVKPGDVVLFYFAGHGSQVWDEDGDEDDGLDETICPTDVLKGDSRADIRDDELNTWLGAIPTQVVVILDNCNAGTGTRSVTPFARARSLARSPAEDLPRPAPAGATGMTAAAPAPRNVLEIAAAQAGEVAVDAEWPGENGAPSTFGGAFTTTLVRNLWRVPRSTSYEDLYQMTAADLRRQRFEQRPLLTTNGDESQPFALADAAPAAGADGAAVPVRSVAGTAVELGGGSAAGITAGSIYHAGESVLRVREVREATATADVVSGGAPRTGASARLVAHVFPDAVLRVSIADVTPATRAAITAAVGAAGTIRFVTNPRDFADLIVRPSERGYVVLGLDGAERHTVAGADAAAVMTQLAGTLRAEAGAYQLAVLENPGQAMSLDFAFGDARTAFREGDEISFRVRAPRNGHLTIVDLGTDGTVTVLYPLDGDGRVAAGQVVELPPAGDTKYEAQRPFGRGIVRAFVTDRPMNLTFAGAAPEQAAAVMRALRNAAGSPPVTGSNAMPTGSWMTASVVYSIDER